MATKQCVQCSKSFRVEPARINKAKFCSYTCYWANKKKQGKPSHLKGFQKGNKVNVGRKRPDTTYRNMYNNGLWRTKTKRQISPGKLEHNGYIWLLMPRHPHANSQGYVREHRVIMEKHIGRFLEPKEVVHHKDNNPLNNELNNLELFNSHSEHMKAHHNPNI